MKVMCRKGVQGLLNTGDPDSRNYFQNKTVRNVGFEFQQLKETFKKC